MSNSPSLAHCVILKRGPTQGHLDFAGHRGLLPTEDRSSWGRPSWGPKADVALLLHHTLEMLPPPLGRQQPRDRPSNQPSPAYAEQDAMVALGQEERVSRRGGSVGSRGEGDGLGGLQPLRPLPLGSRSFEGCSHVEHRMAL